MGWDREFREIREFKEFREFRDYPTLNYSFTLPSHAPNLLSEWRGSGASQKRPPRDSTE